MDFALKRIVNFLDWLTREIPPPKPQPPAIKLIPSQLTPAEQAILDQAEASLRQVEIQSVPVIQGIQENRVIHPAPVQFLAVPEVLEVSSVPVAVEVLEVPEISELPEILATIEPLQAEAQFPAGWIAIEAGEAAQVEQPIAVTETPEVPELPQPTVNISSRKASSRGQLVEQHLEQAWADGFRTYDQLMNYVELATGKGCSKRVISAWKKARKLDEANPVDEAIAA